MSKLRVCYASSDKYSVYSGISIFSLLSNDKEKICDCIYLLGFEVSQSNINIIKKMVEDFDRKFCYIDADEVMKKITQDIKLDLFDGSYATYARAFIEKMIPDYDGMLLYIDSDTIVDKPLVGIEKIIEKMNDKAFAAAIGVNQYYVGNNEKFLSNGNRVYYACGVMLFNLQKWKRERCTEKIVEYIRTNGSQHRYADQTVINNSIDEKLIMQLHPKYNYWGHAYRGRRIYYELGRGKMLKKKTIDEAVTSPVIIHYKGTILHPWLLENESSLSNKFDYYCNKSPWKGLKKESIYTDEKTGEFSKEKKQLMKATKRYLRYPFWVMGLREKIIFIKRKIKGELT